VLAVTLGFLSLKPVILSRDEKSGFFSPQISPLEVIDGEKRIWDLIREKRVRRECRIFG